MSRANISDFSFGIFNNLGVILNEFKNPEIVKFQIREFYNIYSDIPLQWVAVEGMVGKLAIIDNSLFHSVIIEEERSKEIVVHQVI